MELCHEMDEKLLKIKEELMSDIEKLNEPCDEKMTTLKNEIRKLIQIDIGVELKSEVVKLIDESPLKHELVKLCKFLSFTWLIILHYLIILQILRTSICSFVYICINQG